VERLSDMAKDFIVAVVGNIVGSSSAILFGKIVWNPLTYLDMLQTTEYTAGNRAGCFFIAACFAYSAIFSSIFENSLPAGNDMCVFLINVLLIMD
jgi:NCS1 family nucleobase:cation symporter-1